jgi:cytochrome c2
MQAFAQEQSTWNEALFLDFVQSPKGVLSGTSMAFKGVATESDAQALWKYLLASETLED